MHLLTPAHTCTLHIYIFSSPGLWPKHLTLGSDCMERNSMWILEVGFNILFHFWSRKLMLFGVWADTPTDGQHLVLTYSSSHSFTHSFSFIRPLIHPFIKVLKHLAWGQHLCIFIQRCITQSLVPISLVRVLRDRPVDLCLWQEEMIEFA